MNPLVFFANTKLLLTGEYLILHGAEALVLPLVFRQRMTVSDSKTHGLYWESYENGKRWFSIRFDNYFQTISSDGKSRFLQQIIESLIAMKPAAKKLFLAKNIRIDANFNMEWGLGSSSTLISLLAQYAGVDAFALHQRISKGSGYDVVAATQDNSFLFARTDCYFTKQNISLNYPFKNHLFFVYTGRKQRTDESLKQFSRISKTELMPFVKEISLLTRKFMSVKELSAFERLVEEHETIIAKATRQPELSHKLFPDLNGVAKSLGAWGGDFMLLTWRDTEAALQKYLQGKNLNTFFPWEKIVLNRKQPQNK